MPQQGDLAQQKMMLYFMPALFTVMMLFLPSGLGIYMLTNSVLGIVQQQAVERFAPRAARHRGPRKGQLRQDRRQRSIRQEGPAAQALGHSACQIERRLVSADARRE